jgi:hypothetical protein
MIRTILPWAMSLTAAAFAAPVEHAPVRADGRGAEVAPTFAALPRLLEMPRHDNYAQARPVLEQSVIDSCIACHKGEMALGQWSVDALDAAIADIADGSVDHVVPVPTLSDQDRHLLAEALVGAGPGR